MKLLRFGLTLKLAGFTY